MVRTWTPCESAGEPSIIASTGSLKSGQRATNSSRRGAVSTTLSPATIDARPSTARASVSVGGRLRVGEKGWERRVALGAVHDRSDERHALHDLQAEPTQRGEARRGVRHQPHPPHAEVLQDLRAQPVLAPDAVLVGLLPRVGGLVAAE